jgi:O-antigen biosynthesis protein
VAIELEPESKCEWIAGRWHATSSPVWMKVQDAETFTTQRWIRVRYSSSYFDDPVRPLIRFNFDEKRGYEEIMNGPVLGRGEWIGRVPRLTQTVSISPQATSGAFDFVIEDVSGVRRRDLARRSMEIDPRRLTESVGAKLIAASEERWSSLKFAATATPLEDYAQWYRHLHRPMDLGGLDRPRANWRTTPRFLMLLVLNGDSPERLLATIKSLRNQAYERWSLSALIGVETTSQLLDVYREQMDADSRLREFRAEMNLSTIATDFSAEDYVAIIAVGDTLPEHALAIFAETAARNPSLRIIYSDEDSIARNGLLHSPLFKPNWDPVLFQTAPYFGRLTCVQYGQLNHIGLSAASGFVHYENNILSRVAQMGGAEGIGHVRRILYRKTRGRNAPDQFEISTKRGLSRVVQPAVENWPEVTVVIPTKNRVKLLSRCTTGLRELTNYPKLQVVLVDNGSTDTAARVLLDELARLPNFHLLERPGPFNFSALCNDGATVTKSPVLVFLNNDTVILDPEWLREMVRWAVQPKVGVVGAKLLFPNRTIEHAGVVLGHGGMAGHIYQGTPSSASGYLRQLLVTREVGAVTGACIALQRSKFDAVGGFNAEHLPVDLNDIDLCLKLSERGWKAIWTPKAALIHRQSASRGAPFKPSKVYRRERRYFADRWMNIIRDDPYFHPALSLYSYLPALA